MRSVYMAILVASAPPFFVVVSVVATLIASDYSSVSDTMSMLMAPGIQYPWVFQLGVVGYALLVQFLGPLLYSKTGRGRYGALLWVLVFIYGLAGILAAVFRDGYDSAALLQFSEDDVHDFIARFSFSAVVLLIFLTPWALRHRERLRVWRYFSLAIGLFTAILAVPFEIEVWPQYLGLLQRCLFAATMLWIVVTALLLGVKFRESSPSQT